MLSANFQWCQTEGSLGRSLSILARPWDSRSLGSIPQTEVAFGLLVPPP